MGIYSCIGQNKEEVLKSLFEGKSGIGLDPKRTLIPQHYYKIFFLST